MKLKNVLFLMSAMLVLTLSSCTMNSISKDVIANDSRNAGIKLNIKYNNFITRENIIINVNNFEGASADYMRILLMSAKKIFEINKTFNKVYLSVNNKNKFYLKGSYFKTLGEEYGVQNVIYTIRTFPENVMNLNETHAYGTWTGGLLGVMNQQMTDLLNFNKKCFLKIKIKNPWKI
jgi:hypothetical protein